MNFILKCQIKSNSSKSVSDWMDCDRSPDISRIDVFPCLSDYAGTDSAVRLALQSEKELCFTNVLDNNGNDLARGWRNSYRQVNAKYCSMYTQYGLIGTG